MPPLARMSYTIIMACLLASLAGCQTLTQLPAPVSVDAASADSTIPLLAPPPLVLNEEPLRDLSPTVPAVFVVFREQPISELATYLKTTAEQLTARNPGLHDPVPLGALIVIPPMYEVTETATLAAVADATGLQANQLLAANPALGASAVLTAGTVLAMPRLLIVYEAQTLSALAGEANTSADVMLSANPNLPADETVLAGTVLVVPALSVEPTPTR